ncbi:putative membrane protein [Wickerhamomyces ciferrii]|uniref:Membrane protein n=1 Tax=Wickerhamomyces ciferrii (strain ATCC 14091 / BCRC 22168 / CBS 111 / JCM 3599 / NBRC 0793 / NRRL Y-1031 F-60-10) TaxID=1206466 RepID=K0KRG7_WICCF|nr:uncharacterized protein BN7_5317 [Wickerhamomyces ciferrii]CCH45731.1 putative membrane protein [Wickerhamomyces ciferrii]
MSNKADYGSSSINIDQERHSISSPRDEEEQGSSSHNYNEEEQEPEPDVEEFIKKYGDIKVSYIEPSPLSRWFTKPYALNYFHNGTLFRTRHERTSGKLELFFDLIYVGIATNLSSNALKEPTWLSFVKYLFFFIPAWQIWADIKDFMNYYFNDDLLQKCYILWNLALLLIYDNNVEFIFESRTALITTVTTYFLARFSFGLMLVFYSLYIHEHRIQMRIYGTSLFITSSCWYFTLLIQHNSTAGLIVFSAIWFIVEQLCYILSAHPWTKKKLGLTYSTALNIEHEDERLSAFFIIAIGEFMTGIVNGNPLKEGWNIKVAKGIALLVQAFVILELYSHKDGSIKAVHAMRRSAFTAIGFIYIHFPLIASLLLVGDAGADLVKEHEEYPEEKGIVYFYSASMFIAMCALTIHPLLDKPKDNPKDHLIPRLGRIGLRIPIGGIILGLAFTHWKIITLLWIDTLFLLILFIYELFAINPRSFYRSGYCHDV